MRLRLYVEDKNFEAYEVLAKKWLQTSSNRGNVDSVRAIFVPAGDMPGIMSRLVENALADGYDCIMFVLDQESSGDGRDVLLQRCKESFEHLCRDMADRRNRERIRVALVIAKNCLECWLLTDTEAVKQAAIGSKGSTFRPIQRGDTQLLTPQQAFSELDHIWKQVSKRKKRYEKSASSDVIECMTDLRQSARRNQSLGYFLQMVICEKDGCDYRQLRDDL